jgi:hypothetical protein
VKVSLAVGTSNVPPPVSKLMVFAALPLPPTVPVAVMLSVPPAKLTLDVALPTYRLTC